MYSSVSNSSFQHYVCGIHASCSTPQFIHSVVGGPLGCVQFVCIETMSLLTLVCVYSVQTCDTSTGICAQEQNYRPSREDVHYHYSIKQTIFLWKLLIIMNILSRRAVILLLSTNSSGSVTHLHRVHTHHLSIFY